MRGFALLFWACVLSSPALAESYCLRPVTHNPPLSELEQRQPNRLGTAVLHYPGSSITVISPSNRGGLYTIREDRYERFEAEWPTSRLWEYGDHFARPDGSVFGIKANETILYQLNAGGDAFERMPLPKFNSIRYDHASDTIVVWTKKGDRFWQVDNGRLVSLDLGPLPDMRNGAMPRYLPALGGWIAATPKTLYFAKAGQDWQKMSAGWRTRVALYQLEMAQIHYAPQTRGLAIRLGPLVLVYVVDDTGFPRFSYRVEDVRSSWFGGSYPLVGIDASSKTFWGQPRGIDRLGNVVQVLHADGPQEVTDLPLSETPHAGAILAGTLPRDRPVPATLYHAPPLFTVGAETFLFDGEMRVSVPQLAWQVLGDYPRWFKWQDRVFVLSDIGWGEVMPDLSVQQIDYPVPRGQFRFHTNIEQSTRLGLMFAAKGQLWRSPDGMTFEQLTNVEQGHVKQFISDLPGRADALVLSDKGLMLLAPCG